MRNVIKAAAGLALAFGLGTSAIAQDTLTIGIMVPTTGSEATYGQDMANAVNLAIGEINAAGGVLGKQLTSTIGDDGCDAQLAVNAASKLPTNASAIPTATGKSSGTTRSRNARHALAMKNEPPTATAAAAEMNSPARNTRAMPPSVLDKPK